MRLSPFQIKNAGRDVLVAFCFWMFSAVLSPAAAQHTLNIQVIPQSGAGDVELNTWSLTNAAGQPFTISRLDFLLTDFAVRKSDGTWLQKDNWQAYINTAEKRSGFAVDDVPPGKFDRIRFHVGVGPEMNHSNPAQYPADHPLNANLNGLHWAWASGYVFFAIEGHWQRKNAKESGYSYHLGNDPMLMTIELPVNLDVDSSQRLDLTLAVEKVLDLQFTEEDSSTHSREGDALAVRLKQNVERAFQVAAVRSIGSALANNGSQTSKVRKASTATPYRFTFSAQFPMPDLPRDNPLTDEGMELGRRLFFDPLLSKNNSQSCASCHQAKAAFTDVGKRFSLGVKGEQGSRNSMPIFNLAWKKSFFWDGRAPSLRAQILEPIQNPIEMHENLGEVVAKLSKTKTYPELFTKAFGSAEVTADAISLALEQFLFSQLSYDSKFDRALTGQAELTEEEKRGFQLFMTEYDPRLEQFGADCFHCHGGPFFTTHGFANNGLDAEFKDLGRYSVTTNDADKGKFAVPSLRNVAVTAPYMHDGRFKTLEEVIEHYSSGVKRSATLDPNIAKHPNAGVPLSDADKKALVAFLHTLTDLRFQTSKGSDEVVRAEK